jgi:hypothetical protein
MKIAQTHQYLARERFVLVYGQFGCFLKREMPKCPKCGTHSSGRHCPVCGQNLSSIAKEEGLRAVAIWVSGPVAVFGFFNLYRPLDEAVPILLVFCIFLLPALIRIISKRLYRDADWARRAVYWSGCANMLVAAFLAVNGMADRSPVLRIQTSVVRKHLSYGKISTHYYLDVSSWRPTRRDERLQVNKEVYSETQTGGTVEIELHPGFFGFPWGSRVLPG